MRVCRCCSECRENADQGAPKFKPQVIHPGDRCGASAKLFQRFMGGWCERTMDESVCLKIPVCQVCIEAQLSSIHYLPDHIGLVPADAQESWGGWIGFVNSLAPKARPLKRVERGDVKDRQQSQSKTDEVIESSIELPDSLREWIEGRTNE